MVDRHRFAFGTLLVLLVLVAYSSVFPAGFVWDDDVYVVENANLEDWAGLRRIWLEPQTSPQYYPLVFTSFWVEHQAFSTGPRPAHLVNIGLHALNALLLWAVLRRLGLPAAYVIALVFAVHPVHVESVAWITERKNVLSGFFYLASGLVYLSFALDRGSRTPPARRRLAGLYVAALVLFLCALLSKTVTATLPVALLLVLWWQREKVTKADVVAIVPFLALGLAMGLITAWLEVHHVGAMGEAWNLSPAERVVLAGRAIWFYARTLVWPHPLVFIYPKWSVDPQILLHYVPVAGVVAVVAAAWHARHQMGRGPLVGVLFFLVSLFPALGFFNVYPMRYSWVADHFQYLASIGVIALVVGAVDGAARRTRWPVLRVVAAAGAVAVLVPVAWQAGWKYRDLETLWLDTIAKNDTAWIAYSNLGNVRMQQERFAEARALFVQALRVKPDLAEAQNNLGTAWFRGGDLERAVEHHARAVALMPHYAEAHNNLGVDLVNQGKYAEALGHYDQALRIDPGYAMAHYNLANALTRLNRVAEAEAHYRDAIRLRKDFALAHYYLGLSLLAHGRKAEAGGHLDEAFRLMPDFALGRYEVGNALLGQGDAAGAAASYRRALEAKADYAEAHCNLGSALMKQGQTAEAIRHYREALRLKPRYAIAENNLGFALERLGSVDEALVHYEAALTIDPDYATARENLERLRASRASGRR